MGNQLICRMRAFKLLSLAYVAILGAERARAADDFEIIDEDAPLKDIINEKVKDELPEPEMPPNPYGSIDIDTIVKTGTLDGVNPPKTPEEKEVLDAMIKFHQY